MNKIAVYLRLSREDRDKDESLSIGNQRLLASKYIQEHKIKGEVEFFIDDGYTGTNFDRPQFERMMEMIEDGEIDVVIVKDMSRIGRKSSTVTELICEIFPENKVRFIAIDDGIDRIYSNQDYEDEMIIEMKSIINSMYPKDISKKVRSAIRVKQKNGQFVGAFTSYGYIKDSVDHNKLVVDEEASKVVKRIFDLYCSGMGQITIAKKLNEENIPCPSRYKKLKGMNYKNSNKKNSTTYWTYSSIRNILRNEMYIGNMVQNKSVRRICKNKATALPKDKWIIVENSHEAIISKEQWEKTQKLLERNTKPVKLGQNVHIFAGLLRCGDCDRAMVKVRKGKKIVFNCGSYNKYGKKFCTGAHSISEEALVEIVKEDLNSIIKNIEIENLVDKESEIAKKEYTKRKEKEDKKYKTEMNKLLQKKERIYGDYLDELISKEEYVAYKERMDERIDALKGQIRESTIEQEEDDNKKKWIDRLLNIGEIEELDRETVLELVDMIRIYEGNKMEIIYNFSNDLNIL